MFLRMFDAYCNEVRARAEQPMCGGTPSSSEISRPVNLKYCMDNEYINAAIILGRIENVSSCDNLHELTLRKYLDKRAEESKEVVTLPMLDEIVNNNLKMDMSDNLSLISIFK